MRVFHKYHDVPLSSKGGVIAIGNFDGVHKGHQTILKTAKQIAKADNVPFNVLTFEPHPSQAFDREKEPFRLTPIRSKVRVMSKLGIDNLIIMHFVADFYNMSAEDFIKRVIVGGLKASHLVVGEGYHFGKDSLGDTSLLQKLGEKYGFKVTVVPNLLNKEKERISSSLARFLLRRGDISKLKQILGRYWEIEARVIKGNQIGRTIGFPTANLNTMDYATPRMGVYAARIGIPDKKGKITWFDGIMNYGSRPTVDGETVFLEAHIFDFSGDIYGKRIIVRPIKFLRPEMKMKGLEDLKNHIKEDIVWAKIILSDTAGGNAPFMIFNFDGDTDKD